VSLFIFGISSYKDYNNRKNEFKQENTSPVIQETSNFFNKQKSLGYKTSAEKVKDWYEKDRKLFKDNFDINSYNLAQPNN